HAANFFSTFLGASNGQFSWSPGENDGPYTYNVTFRVTDQGGKFNDQTVTITVSEFNRNPTLADPADVSVNEQPVSATTANINLGLFANDNDRDATGTAFAGTTYSVSLQNTNTTHDANFFNGFLNTSNGFFSWSPLETDGPY